MPRESELINHCSYDVIQVFKNRTYLVWTN